MFFSVLALALAAAPARADAVFADKVVAAAQAQTKERVVYDGRYFKLAYPGGDVPAGPKREDVLFAWKVTGHYRYAP